MSEPFQIFVSKSGLAYIVGTAGLNLLPAKQSAWPTVGGPCDTHIPPCKEALGKDRFYGSATMLRERYPYTSRNMYLHQQKNGIDGELAFRSGKWCGLGSLMFMI